MLKIKIIAFCLTLTLLWANSYAQPSIAWQRCYGTSFSDSFSDAIYSHEGGVIAAIDYGGYDGDAEGLYDLSYPATIVKFDSLSEIEWYSSFGGTTNSSYFKQVEENQDGSIIACGGTYSVDGDFADNNGSWDLIMVKMDAFGNKIWSYCYGSTGVDEFESFIQTSDGGYLLCGLSMSSGGDIPGHYGDGFGGDGIVIKTDSMGIVLWAKNLGTSGDDGVAGSILEIDNGFYILNVSCGGDNYDMEGSGISGRKRWLIKMDSLGNVIDENIISGETDLDIGPGREMIYYNEKILIVDGANPLTNYFPDVNGIGGNSDGAIGIFTKDLDFVDLKIYGGSLSDYLYRILVDENENYYLLGLTKSLDVNLTENYDNGLYWDYWILKLDLNFNVMWSRNFGSSGSCSETGCGSFGGQFLLKDNKIYTYIKNEVPDVIPDYDMNCGNQNLLGVPNTDAWLVCFDLTTAIQENYRGNEIINVNPNPVNFSLIVSTTFEENFDISIQSTTGAVVFKQFNNIAKQINISTEFFQNGMYILQVTTASGVKYFEKIIVMH